MSGTSWFSLTTRFVYGVLLPLMLLYLALSSHFSLVRERQVISWQEKMQDSLDNIAKYHQDDRFFHGILQLNFRQAAAASDPLTAVAQVTARLKKVFNQKLQFIVWDKNGKVIPGLSDDTRFQYVIRSLHQQIEFIQLHIATVFPPLPETIVELASKIKLLRSFLGQFLMEKHMALPLLEGYLGSCIRASEEESRRLLWYQKFNSFGLLCFIHKDLTDNEIGGKMLVDRFNGLAMPVKLALFSTKDRSLYGIEDDQAFEALIRMEANSFFDSAVEFKRTDDFLFLFRQLSPRLIVISRLRLKENLLSVDHEVKVVMFKVLRALLLLFFLLYCASLRSDGIYLSVRQKLMLLFLFANGLPLMILLATGYEFFEQKKNTLINETHDNSARILKDFDNLYPAGRDVAAGQMRDFLAVRNEKFLHKTWPAAEVESLQRLVADLSPSESYLFSDTGEQLFFVGTDALTSSVRFVRDFFGGALDFFNNSSARFSPKIKTMIEEFSDEGSVYYGIIHQLGRISPQNYGSGIRWTYLDLLGDRHNYNSWGFLLVAWRPEKLQRAFLRLQLDEINAKIAPRKILVMEKGNETIFPEDLNGVADVRKIMHRTLSRKLVRENQLMIGPQTYVATAMTGTELSESVIMAVYPRDLTLTEINRLFYRVILAVFTSVFVVLLIIRFFSRRLIAPVESLSEGVAAIGERDFSFRSNYDSDDEFGDLIRVFNTTIDGMQELAVGTAVQESLLPPSHARFGSFTLYARSVFMSKMGGDYFDYFSTGKDSFGVFFGDVAGHGIPAALIMAMAKAAIACAQKGYQGPAKLLSEMNSIFLKLKDRGLRRMMTALSFDFNSLTGEYRLANAGQCYPIVVSAGGKGFRYLKAVGMPLGNVSRRAYNELTGKLESGDILLLYSDGIIEATNADEAVFDFAGLEKLLVECYDPDIETYWQRIFKGYSEWASQQDDDITMLMLKYELQK